MALDRQSIERKDFPIGRRGYDPEAVDTHLSALAGEVEELRRSARRRSESLAAAASEQVRAIVEAAETTAGEIQHQAEEEAREIRTEASSEAQTTREQATGEARQYVGQVSESTTSMLQRIDAMENELGALIESLRTGSNRLNADLQLLEGNLAEVRDAVVPRPRFEPERGAGAEMPASSGVEPAASGAVPEADQAVPVAGATEPAPQPAAEPQPQPAAEPQPQSAAAAEGSNGSDEAEGARLVALNMALNGTPREETDRYLAENFKLTDRRGLLDEVYSSVEG